MLCLEGEPEILFSGHYVDMFTAPPHEIHCACDVRRKATDPKVDL